MPWFWDVNIETARWEGTDLTFQASTDAGPLKYVIRHRRLRDTAQRTGGEALSLNLPLLRDVLIQLARSACPGETVTLD